MVAIILLNIGLYFILYYLTPFIAGIAFGFLLRDYRRTAIAGFAGSMIAYCSVFVIMAPELMEYLTSQGLMPDITSFYSSIILAAILLSMACVLGVFIGAKIAPKPEAMYQQ